MNFQQPMPNPVWLDVLIQVAIYFIVPVCVAVVAYLLVDRLGEWRRRGAYSRLGVAIIESLQEEVGTGVVLMTNALKVAGDNNASAPPIALPPHKSWSGMSTIPDEVLLRIIETSTGRWFDGFPPRECRIHCKNYFEHMCENYENALKQSLALAQGGLNWREPIRTLLAGDAGRYIQAATGVGRMLDHAKNLLEQNARAIFPK